MTIPNQSIYSFIPYLSNLLLYNRKRECNLKITQEYFLIKSIKTAAPLQL